LINRSDELIKAEMKGKDNNPLSKYSTTELKKELKRRKGGN